ncbi:hypothetical protein HYDPIDRAFT_112868 [Hydnomerulius pinastri MD-312]|uniref:CHAT domain-containing protein n=1 Tax=Hydnomerulius pinastri MD-312 TaxID=994086 RepID=A0A0C9VCZ7_9AGAM|nr:hypothetical protein HYDPIDRAFT_112868 [Hydnomerulius pinastri MD-312]
MGQVLQLLRVAATALFAIARPQATEPSVSDHESSAFPAQDYVGNVPGIEHPEDTPSSFHLQTISDGADTTRHELGPSERHPPTSADDLWISQEESALQLMSDCPEKCARLWEISQLLSGRFNSFGDLADLSKSISAIEHASRLAPDDHPNKPRYLLKLSDLLYIRSQILRDADDWRKSIIVKWETMAFIPDDNPRKPDHLDRIGVAFYRFFDRFGDFGDIDQSITALETAVRLTPSGHPDRPGYMNNLALSFKIRYERRGDLSDLEKSIVAFEDALRPVADGDPDKPDYLTNLGTALARRFDHLGDFSDIQRSIEVKLSAVQLTPDDHPMKPIYQHNLGNSFMIRFQRLGDIADIDQAILMIQNAAQLAPDDSPNKPIFLNSLGNSYSRRFRRVGDRADIDLSVVHSSHAARLIPNDHPEKPSYLSSFGTSLVNRFQHFGDLSDIDQSITLGQTAVEMTPESHPGKHVYLNCLGISLSCRFERFGDINDINGAIAAFMAAIRLTPERHPAKPQYLSNLGVSFQNRFCRLDAQVDIDQAISTLQQAVDLTPDHHPGHLGNLGNSLFRRFQRFDSPGDLDRSITASKMALQRIPDDHPEKPAYLNNFGTALSYRFERTDAATTDIDESITAIEHSLRLTPHGHPDKPGRQHNLAHSFFCRFKRLDDRSALDNAVSLWAMASNSPLGAASIRFDVSLRWIQCAQSAHHPSLLDAFKASLHLLPQLAWLGLPIKERHRELLRAGNVARDAAAAAIEDGKYETAVEWLEQGRCIVWAQIFQLRTPVDELRAMQPELAARLTQVSNDLERASTRNLPSSPALISPSLEAEAQRHRQLTLEWEEIVREIRALPGFEHFLLPKSISELSQAACSGPVVFLNASASRDRCDALVLRQDDIHKLDVLHVPLAPFTYVDALKLQNWMELFSKLGHVVRDNLDRASGFVFLEGTPDDKFERILSQLWFRVVKPVLTALGMVVPASGELPRIFWCPTGPFTFLPIHAAGHYSDTHLGPKVFDYAISSYTPTLSALIPPGKGAVQGNPGLLVVAQQSAMGNIPLPGASEELSRITARVKAVGGFPISSLEESGATVTNVLERMKELSWVHFACHGVQDAGSPTDSGLLLADGRLKLSDIIKLSRPHKGLAFLSACQTATGAAQLPEEAVHIAAGMLLAGYGGVIATMWSIMDRDAPDVADHVYAYLCRDQTEAADYRDAARALHHAVQNLRERKGRKSYLTWVPFIHVGL